MWFANLINVVIFLTVVWILGNKFLVKKELKPSKTKERILNKKENLKDMKNEKEDLSEEFEITSETLKEEKELNKAKTKLDKLEK